MFGLTQAFAVDTRLFKYRLRHLVGKKHSLRQASSEEDTQK